MTGRAEHRQYEADYYADSSRKNQPHTGNLSAEDKADVRYSSSLVRECAKNAKALLIYDAAQETGIDTIIEKSGETAIAGFGRDSSLNDDRSFSSVATSRWASS